MMSNSIILSRVVFNCPIPHRTPTAPSTKDGSEDLSNSTRRGRTEDLMIASRPSSVFAMFCNAVKAVSCCSIEREGPSEEGMVSVKRQETKMSMPAVSSIYRDASIEQARLRNALIALVLQVPLVEDRSATRGS